MMALFIFCPAQFADSDATLPDQPLPAANDSEIVTWALVAEGELCADWRRSTLDNLPPAPEHTRVCVVLPGEQVLLTQVILKGKKARHLQQALPYLVEEHLATEIENMHIVSGARQPGDQYPVAAVDNRLLDRILEKFKAAKICLDLVIPDTLLLPWDPGAITVYLDGERSLLRYSATLGLAIDTPNLTIALEAVLRGGGFTEIQVYHTVQCNAEFKSRALLQLRALQTEHAIAIREQPLEAPGTGFLSKHAGQDAGINLLHGKAAVEHRHRSQRSAWRPPLTAASALLAVYCLYNLGMGLYLNAQAQDLYRESEALYRQYFPDDNRIINIKTQTQAHLRRSAAGASEDRFLQLMGRFGQAWQNNRPQSLTIQQLRFDRQRGQLTLDVQAGSIQQLEQFRQQLLAHGLNAELLSANEEQQRVRGHMQLTEAG